LITYSIKPLLSVCTWFAFVSSTSIVATAVSAQTAPSPAATPSKPRVTFFETESKQDFTFSFENFLSSALDGAANFSTTDSVKTNPAIPYSSTSLSGVPTTQTVSGTITVNETRTQFTSTSLPFTPSLLGSVIFSDITSQTPNTSNLPAGTSLPQTTQVLLLPLVVVLVLDHILGLTQLPSQKQLLLLQQLLKQTPLLHLASLLVVQINEFELAKSYY